MEQWSSSTWFSYTLDTTCKMSRKNCTEYRQVQSSPSTDVLDPSLTSHIPTLAFSESVLFADAVIWKEFCWQVQQRSDFGFVIRIWGRYFRHMSLKLWYPATRKVRVAETFIYSFHTAFFVVVVGSSWRSLRLYPGILPGSRMAFSSA